jgi:excisionase family DNA binding protein
MTRSVLLDRAAEILGVSRRTVYYRIRAGRLQTIRTRCGSQRVLVESIEALLREPPKARGRGVAEANGHAISGVLLVNPSSGAIANDSKARAETSAGESC